MSDSEELLRVYEQERFGDDVPVVQWTDTDIVFRNELYHRDWAFFGEWRNA